MKTYLTLSAIALAAAATLSSGTVLAQAAAPAPEYTIAYNIGATMPFGAATARLGYNHNKIGGTDMIGVGVDYNLSKTTALFADIGKYSSLANATFQVGFQKYF